MRIVHRVAKESDRLSDYTHSFHFLVKPLERYFQLSAKSGLEPIFIICFHRSKTFPVKPKLYPVIVQSDGMSDSRNGVASLF